MGHTARVKVHKTSKAVTFDLLVTAKGGKNHTLRMPASFHVDCSPGIDTYVRVLDATPAVPVIAVDMYCEEGGDYFTREIVIAAVWLAPKTGAPKLLWSGEGKFRTWFACNVYDIPMLTIRNHHLVAAQKQGATQGEAHDGDPCPVAKVITKVLKRVKLPAK